MKKFIKSFKYAFEGILTGIKEEQNMKIHISIMILVIIFGILLKISKAEWIMCIALFGLVISMEMINTAIENTVDLITKEKNEQAKIAKDVAAGLVQRPNSTYDSVVNSAFKIADKLIERLKEK